jgi:hypothetical protein
MERNHKFKHYTSFAIIFLLISITILPQCFAQIKITPNTEKVLKNLKIKHSLNNSYNFFKYAIIFGTYEVRGDVVPIFWLNVYNRQPWYNQTINIIGYVSNEHKFVNIKAYWIDCALWIGFARLHHVCAICYDVTAW